MSQEEKNVITAREDFEQDLKDKKAEEKANKLPRKRENSLRRKRIILGAVFSLFALIGVLSVVSGLVSFGQKQLDNSDEKKYYSNLLNTLVMYDPLPFESPESADQDLLLISSVWNAIMNEDLSVYEKDEYEQTLLPTVVVDKYFSGIFGTEYKLNHHTFTNDDAEFVYDEEKQTYTVPITSYPSGYSAEVAKIKNSHGTKVVTVGYLSALTSWADTSERTVVKYVDYVFEKENSTYALKEIKESNMKVEAPEANTDNVSSQQ